MNRVHKIKAGRYGKLALSVLVALAAALALVGAAPGSTTSHSEQSNPGKQPTTSEDTSGHATHTGESAQSPTSPQVMTADEACRTLREIQKSPSAGEDDTPVFRKVVDRKFDCGTTGRARDKAEGESRDPSPKIPSDDLFEGAKLYVDPDSSAASLAEQWHQEGRYADAEEIEEIATGSQARWFPGGGDVRAEVERFVTTANDAGALPTLVAYNIPIRDCGSYSSGGAGSAAEYRAWIDSFAAGIGSERAAVILEPDALSHTDCLSDAQKQERYDLISYAIRKLEKAHTDVYVDAGHSDWHSSQEMASRLEAAGISQAEGFVLNVSNYEHTKDNVRYGEDLSSKVGDKHFVVGTARNGNGPGDTWCNPAGRALGERPTSTTADPLADAYLWIKPPGESDGTCNGGPPAGQWWPSYALGLAERAAY